MPSIEELERRLQLMQEHVERAHLSGKELLIVMARADERSAQAALDAARIRLGEH